MVVKDRKAGCLFMIPLVILQTRLFQSLGSKPMCRQEGGDCVVYLKMIGPRMKTISVFWVLALLALSALYACLHGYVIHGPAD